MTARAGEFFEKAIILALVVVPLAGTMLAVRLVWGRAAGWDDLALLIGLYIPISLGITIGFHRYLTHRGFRAHGVLKAVLLVLGSMALEGSAISWAANHRKHHALSDQAGDPHSPADGFFHAHVGWLFTSKAADQITYARRTKDRSRNQWLVGLLALGEGWHNNHHAFPRSALHGLRWWQFDLSGLTIRLFERLRLIRDVQRVSRGRILERVQRTIVSEEPLRRAS
ncbi:MAG: acyl-CoA desaturase [Chloroflexi bacterium]|nr:acyl-CoA desaturase [Chloroflexota bacterium]